MRTITPRREVKGEKSAFVLCINTCIQTYLTSFMCTSEEGGPTANSGTDDEFYYLLVLSFKLWFI
jgi:hypothetical protein